MYIIYMPSFLISCRNNSAFYSPFLLYLSARNYLLLGLLTEFRITRARHLKIFKQTADKNSTDAINVLSVLS